MATERRMIHLRDLNSLSQSEQERVRHVIPHRAYVEGAPADPSAGKPEFGLDCQIASSGEGHDIFYPVEGGGGWGVACDVFVFWVEEN